MLQFMWRQVILQNGTARQIGWVEDRRGLRVGMYAELKGELGWWKILKVSTITLNVPPDKSWHVGGL